MGEALMTTILWEKISFKSSKEEIRKINSFEDYISAREKEGIIKSIEMKSELISSGFVIEHFKKKEFDKTYNYKFSASKGPFIYATSGNNYYLPVIEIYNWIKRIGDVKNEFI